MNEGRRSDLACECRTGGVGEEEGFEILEHRIGEIRILRMRICTPQAAERLQKPCGSYVTLECGRVPGLAPEARQVLSRLLSGELRGMSERLTGKKPDGKLSVLVVGLGNASLTPDAIGPKTVERVAATRHLRTHEAQLFRSLGCASVATVSPGVLGETGIESLELLRGAVEAVRPDLVVAIDALAARSCQRLASTVQLSDTGIEPGSGVGNHRSPLTRQTLGVPVLSLGVPTVVDSGTLVRDALLEAGIRELPSALEEVLRSGQRFFVSPRDCDEVTEAVSALLSGAIGDAFLGGVQEAVR